MPTSVLNVAKYILEASGEMTTIKLQKLCYYAQAWVLVNFNEPLFSDEIQAWAKGPVIPNLYEHHRAKYLIKAEDLSFAKSNDIPSKFLSTLDAVIKEYGRFSATQLSELTHQEKPWLNARVGHVDGEISVNQISTYSIKEYYGNLNSDNSDELNELEWSNWMKI